jgi:hypothetical protein
MRQALAASGRWLHSHGTLSLAYLLVGLVYTALFYLSFNGIADYTNAHHFFPEPMGGYAMAVVLECSILFAFLVFRRSPIFAGTMLGVFAAVSYWLQRLHGEYVEHGRQVLHPNLITVIVPFALVVMGIALHRIRPAEPPAAVPMLAVASSTPDEETTATLTRTETREQVTRQVRQSVTAKAAALEMLRSDPELPTAAITGALGISERTVRNARAVLKAEANGGGHGT